MLGTLAEVERFLGMRATWFELVTAAAYAWFADMAAEVVVAEVGLGGRYDATNVATADVAVVTNVELDHTQILGTTREAIAAEKSGIIKAGSLLVLGEEDPSVSAIFEAEAEKRRGTGHLEAGLRVRLLGRPPCRRRASCRPVDAARAVLRLAPAPPRRAPGRQRRGGASPLPRAFSGTAIDPEVVGEALASVRVPGRLEVMRRHPLVVLDGAHNPAGAAAAGRALVEDFAAARRVIVVMGCLRGRDPAESCLAALGPERIDVVVACRPPSPRAQEPESVVRGGARAWGLWPRSPRRPPKRSSVPWSSPNETTSYS